MPQSLCLTIGDGAQRAALGDRHVGSERMAPAEQRQVALHAEPAAAGRRLHVGRPERDGLALEDFLVDRLLDVRLVVVAERLHAAGALEHAQRGGVDVELEARAGRVGADARAVASQEVTWKSRLWPALAAAPVRLVLTESVPSAGPSTYVPA